MRNPLRTEAEAFSFVLAASVLFLALAVGIGVGAYLAGEPKANEPAIWERDRRDQPTAQ